MFGKELKDELQNNQDINNDIQKPLHERDYFKELCYCEPCTRGVTIHYILRKIN
jgi:hypothetical protein